MQFGVDSLIEVMTQAVLAFKTVQQRLLSNADVLVLLGQFRCMLNDCIRIGLTENVTSLRALSLKAYRQLSCYDVMSYYKLCAISKAAGILRNYRRAKRRNTRAKIPYATRPQLLTCYGFKIVDGILLIPSKPRKMIAIPLNKNTLNILTKPDQTVRSITLTASTVGITYSKEIVEIERTGLIGIDNNLNNITLADSRGLVERYNLEKVSQIKSKYRMVKSCFTRNDVHVMQRIYRKYGRKERDKVSHILHNVSKHIVEDAKAKQFGIVMEKLTGLRKLYRRGNGQGGSYRGRLNSWSFRELQRRIEYKARCEGIPVLYVKPHGTSSKCLKCGSKMIPEEGRMLRCTLCGFTVDRDVNAARNILARGLRFKPDALPSEAMVKERVALTPILKVDGSEVS